jgi:6-phosphogluconolactonase
MRRSRLYPVLLYVSSGSLLTVISLASTLAIAQKTTSSFPPARFLYVLEGNGVSGWNVNPTTGAVTPTGQGVVAAGTNPYRVSPDWGGYRLYVANVGSNDISAFFINRSNGYLTPVPGSPFAVGRTATAVAVHPSGDYVYAAGANDAAGDYVAVFHVNSNGSLSPIAGSPFPTQVNPVAIVADPGGKYVFVADSSYQGYIDAFSVNAVTGALTPIAGSPFELTMPAGCPGGTFAEDIIEDHAGAHLYTADAFDNAISAFGVTPPVGNLFQVQGSAFPDYTCQNPMIGFDPDTVTIDPTDQFLYAGNGGAQTISLYKVEATTGALTKVGISKACFGGVSSAPVLRVDPSGNFLVTVGVTGPNCTGGKAIVVLRINSSNGYLSSVPGSPFPDANPTGPVSGAMAVTQ